MIVELAPEVDEIVVDKISSDLDWISIVSVFEIKKTSRYAAKISKVGPVFKELTGYDLVLHVWKDRWETYNDNQKEALVFHELCHIDAYEKEGKKKIRLLPHPVEEFPEVVKEYGLWNSPLQRFGDVVEKVIEQAREEEREKD